MKYTTEELKHFEMLVNFFNHEMHVEGEYPFYTDDRLLDEDGKVRKKVYRNGKRRSMSLNPTSINVNAGKHQLNLHIIQEQTCLPPKQFNNMFMTFVVKKWSMLLTQKQKAFINDVLVGNEDNYTKQHRFYFRQEIQKRLKMAFIGVGGVEIPHYKIGEYRVKVITIERFLELSEDNEAYSKEIIKRIDKLYVNNIIYKSLSADARQNIVDFYFGKTKKIKTKHLSEFHNHILNEKEKLISKGIAIQEFDA